MVLLNIIKCIDFINKRYQKPCLVPVNIPQKNNYTSLYE
uniref:Uncharacterized protein n=1 Tax=Anguilla anguilla TaxID=7936 RepID=A0A0E9VD25_ANGAN